jgi:hypothetical protein
MTARRRKRGPRFKTTALWKVVVVVLTAGRLRIPQELITGAVIIVAMLPR